MYNNLADEIAEIKKSKITLEKVNNILKQKNKISLNNNISTTIELSNQLSKSIQTDPIPIKGIENPFINKYIKKYYREDPNKTKNSIIKICKASINNNSQNLSIITKSNDSTYSIESEIIDIKKMLDLKIEENKKSEKKISELQEKVTSLENKIIDLTNENIELKKRREQAKHELLSLNKVKVNMENEEANEPQWKEGCKEINVLHIIQNIINEIRIVYKDLVNLISLTNSEESRMLFIKIENRLNLMLSRLKEITEEQKNLRNPAKLPTENSVHYYCNSKGINTNRNLTILDFDKIENCSNKCFSSFEVKIQGPSSCRNIIKKKVYTNM